jgi:hypothetical protein
VAAMTSCAVGYMDWPASSEWDHWKKSDIERSAVDDFFVNVCGFKSNRNLIAEDPNLKGNGLVEKRRSILINAEKCMFTNGFSYVDKPAGFIESKNGGRCRWKDIQNYPSCQSLKDQIK